MQPHSCAAVSNVTSQPEGSWFSTSVWSVHVLTLPAWVSSGYSGFFPQSKHPHVRLIGDCKLATDVR